MAPPLGRLRWRPRDGPDRLGPMHWRLGPARSRAPSSAPSDAGATAGVERACPRHNDARLAPRAPGAESAPSDRSGPRSTTTRARRGGPGSEAGVTAAPFSASRAFWRRATLLQRVVDALVDPAGELSDRHGAGRPAPHQDGCHRRSSTEATAHCVSERRRCRRPNPGQVLRAMMRTLVHDRTRTSPQAGPTLTRAKTANLHTRSFPSGVGRGLMGCRGRGSL